MKRKHFTKGKGFTIEGTSSSGRTSLIRRTSFSFFYIIAEALCAVEIEEHRCGIPFGARGRLARDGVELLRELYGVKEARPYIDPSLTKTVKLLRKP